MKKIILWISAITRYMFSVLSRANSPTHNATNPFKRKPPKAIFKPKNGCMGLHCQQNCKGKPMPACFKGKVPIELKDALT